MLATAYAQWIDRYRYRVVVGSVLVALALAAVTAHLTVEADMSYLLPAGAESVQHLRAIEKRARVLGTVMIAVQSDDRSARARAAVMLRDGLEAFVPDALSSVTFDDRVARRFAWDHRWLYVTVDDLRTARDALQAEIRDAHLRANPLYVGLDDDAPSQSSEDAHRLRQRLHDAEAAKDATGELVSKDGRTQLLILRTAHAPGDIDRDSALLRRVAAVLDEVRAAVPDVEIGAAGDVVLTVAEHAAIVDGMVLAVIATVVLVLLGLLLYYRSIYLVGALSWALVVGAVATFAFAKVAVGHLNLATAFLSSIVIGNGINFGIVLVARYQEAVRAGERGVTCIATTIRSTIAGTLAAALAAAVAYGSLVLTSFRGFRDFGIIAGVGILPCWIAAYTVLPAVLAIAERRRRTERAPPMLGEWLALLAPHHASRRAVVLAVVVAIAGGVTWRYLTDSPFERDFRNLRSHSQAIDAESWWMERVDKAFGQGISGGFVIAVDRRSEVTPLIAKLRAHDAHLSEHDKLFARIDSMDDLVPPDQPARIALLDELRGMLTPEALDELEPKDRDEALALRPPVGLRPLRDEDVPDELAWPYIEADGSRGKLILALPGWGYDNWDAEDIVRFARDVRGLDLGPDVLLGGSSFVFADMLVLITHDGPLATLAALTGAILLVLALVGWRRHGVATLACGIAGVLGMLAISATVGLHVNFLDFVALPITIGIGIDYAVNLAARDRHEGVIAARELLAGTGSAVLLCSFTTIVGYGSLLLSRNQGIRSFGTASILGEATCLGAALLFAPALLSVFRTKTRTPSTTVTAR